jgi:hypothetical protein
MRLIPGTIKDLCSESSKAKLVSGKKSDLMIEQFEDIPPRQVGISNNGRGGSVQTSNTDEEALLKYRLTKGRAKAAYKQVVNGVHAQVEIDSFCNTVMLVGMNAALSAIPSAIASRFNNIQFQKKKRLHVDGREQTMFEKFAHCANQEIKEARDLIIERDRRNQCFSCIISLLCWSGVFEGGVDMAVPILIWTETLARAREKGLHETGEYRHFERLIMHAETCCDRGCK